MSNLNLIEDVVHEVYCKKTINYIAEIRLGNHKLKIMLKICVVGSGSVGKSCVTIRYLRNEFTNYYDPTMEETYEAEIRYAGRNHKVEIVDTAGQEEFSSFLESSISRGDAFMILYAINSLASWNDLKVLRNKIAQGTEGKNLGIKIPMIIVGNKRDLEDERELAHDIAEDYAASIRVPYIETSAKTGYHIQDAFELMMAEIDRTNPELLIQKTKGKHSQSSDTKKKDCTIV